MKKQIGPDNSKQGSLTVFFLMSVLPMVILCLTLLSAARYWTEKSDVSRRIHLAGKSVLSCYDAELVRRYGLYGVRSGGLEEKSRFFLQNGGQVPLDRIRTSPVWLLDHRELWEGLFSYSLVEAEAGDAATLQEPACFQRQLSDFMEYRSLQTLMEFLKQQLGLVSQTIGNGGLNAKYAHLQEELLEYNDLYSELIEVLYAAEGDTLCVTVTREEAYRPSNIAAALAKRKEGEEVFLTALELESLDNWQNSGEQIAEQNYVGALLVEQLQTQLDAIRETLREIDQLVGQMQSSGSGNGSSEETVNGISAGDGANAEAILQEVQKVRDELWGLHGESVQVLADLRKNEQLAEGVSVLLEQIAEPLLTGAPVDPLLWDKTVLKVQHLTEYRDDFDLKYVRSGSGKKLNLGRIKKWLEKQRIDLKQYGKNQNLLENSDGEGLGLFAKDMEDQLSQSLQQLQKDTSILSFAAERFDRIEYGLGMFQNLRDIIVREEGGNAQNLRGEAFAETYFANEAEYLIAGSGNEYQNLKTVELEILALRAAFNLAFLKQSSSKQAAIHAVSDGIGTIVAPGIGNAVLSGALMFLWSTAEAYLDYRDLLDGKKVPLLKTEETWKSDLDGIMERKNSWNRETDPSEDESGTGMEYKMYLRILLWLTDSETLFSRIRTLIALNMQKNGDADFSLAERTVSFVLRAQLEGKSGRSYAGEERFAYQ